MIKYSKLFSKRNIIISVILLIILIAVSVYIITTNNVKNNITENYSCKNPIIPYGFKKVETETASWILENEIPKGWNDGLVIEDDSGNQFVWVPLDIDNFKYSDWDKKYYKIYEKDTLDKNILEDNQIFKYGGFYISRYEAGVSNEMNNTLINISPETNDVVGIPTSKKNIRPWNFISFENARNNALSMYDSNFIHSDLMTEKQWVTIIQWLSNSKYDVGNDSSSFGNYSNVNFNFSGLYSIDYGENYTYMENKIKSQYNMILSSGATDRNMTKNIYDLAGNLLEYIDGYYAVGGHFDDTGGYNASTRALRNRQPLEKVGFRVSLCVE